MTDATPDSYLNTGLPDDAAHRKYCSGCGAAIHRQAATCPRCGAPQANVESRKNRIVAFLLALFLGGLGAHKFYLGRTGWGVTYLIFCWTLIPAMIALVEAILLIAMSDPAFQRRFK